eukprot:TRINITY_DN17366_c0_g1_i1.p1 TRINITY_DN17366_c0_g1~~TRINITY_DN17366_c0_g1_i1.p1  ORF type:complete len:207 (-),score=6.89 TRINITY_DN17366_c0_g1_i1:97-636(-)
MIGTVRKYEARSPIRLLSCVATVLVATFGCADAELAVAYGAHSVFSSKARETSAVFLTPDTCQQLYWFGFKQVSSCRDTWSPDYSPNCRCQREGVALPAKYCEMPVDGTNRTGSDPKTQITDKVLGICDVCCSRDHIVGLWLLMPFFFLKGPILICCWCARAGQKSSPAAKGMRLHGKK